MDTYTTEEMDAAIQRVETAKNKYPVGWVYLKELNLPGDDLVAYTFANAHAQVERLQEERDFRIVYSVGWLNGISVGVALGEGRNGTD